jgi:CDP-diacylglycerol--serine O-phosphatidyltransferase
VANLSSGLIAIWFAFYGKYEYAAISVVIGMICDALDGAAARYFDASSEFGKELDSLCDVIAYGVAPAFILFTRLVEVPLSCFYALFLLPFPICAALRLARYNTNPPPESGGFTGMPTTAAGGILAICAINPLGFQIEWLIALCLLLSFLMLSNFTYPHPKALLRLKNRLLVMILLGLFSLAYLVFLSEWLFLPLLAYAICGLLLKR